MRKSGIYNGYPNGSDSQSQKGGGSQPPKKEEQALIGLPEHISKWFASLENFDILLCYFRRKTVVYQFVKHTACIKCNTQIACFMRNRRDLEQRRQIREVLMNDLFGISNDLVCLTREHGKDTFTAIKFRLNDLEAVIACESELGGDREVLLDAQSTKERLTAVSRSILSQLHELPKEES